MRPVQRDLPVRGGNKGLLSIADGRLAKDMPWGTEPKRYRSPVRRPNGVDRGGRPGGKPAGDAALHIQYPEIGAFWTFPVGHHSPSVRGQPEEAVRRRLPDHSLRFPVSVNPGKLPQRV